MAKDNNVVILMYNLIEYRNNYLKNLVHENTIETNQLYKIMTILFILLVLMRI